MGSAGNNRFVLSRIVAKERAFSRSRPPDASALMGAMASRKPRPYDDAPTLPEGERIDVRTLVRGEWIELEVGPGRGMFILERALVAPEPGLLGLEVRRKWAAIVDGRLAARGLAHRARVLAEDARHALARLGPAASVRRAFLLFPDPWWKKRHQKRLVMGDAFVREIGRLLEPAGELFVETDVLERAKECEAVVGSTGLFLPPEWLADNPYGARTNREKRAIADGLPVYRLRFQRGNL
jgi:tRNA (guanine-N7-)-methyltransferase